MPRTIDNDLTLDPKQAVPTQVASDMLQQSSGTAVMQWFEHGILQTYEAISDVCFIRTHVVGVYHSTSTTSLSTAGQQTSAHSQFLSSRVWGARI